MNCLGRHHNGQRLEGGLRKFLGSSWLRMVVRSHLDSRLWVCRCSKMATLQLSHWGSIRGIFLWSYLGKLLSWRRLGMSLGSRWGNTRDTFRGSLEDNLVLDKVDIPLHNSLDIRTSDISLGTQEHMWAERNSDRSL